MNAPARQLSNLFLDMVERDLPPLVQSFQFRRLAAGETLWQEGENCPGIAFVVAGELEARKKNEFGSGQVVIGRIRPGSLAGENALFGDPEADCSLRARKDSALLLLERESFERICREYPDTALKLLRSMMAMLSLRMRHMSQRLTTLF